MSTKLKALGLGILAVLAVGAFAAANVGAETGGHFVSEGSQTENTSITGFEEGEHITHLAIPGLPKIGCDKDTYEGTVKGNTATEITITAKYEECYTTTAGKPAVTVHMNGCDYLFTIGKKATEHNTVHLKCPENQTVVLTHPECTIHIPPQDNLEGIVYKTDKTVVEAQEIHTITMEATVEDITIHFEKGFCILLGTSHVGNLEGSVTVEGFEDKGVDEAHPHGEEGPLVNITATGSED